VVGVPDTLADGQGVLGSGGALDRTHPSRVRAADVEAYFGLGRAKKEREGT